MERDENHFYQYMLNELGTSGSRDGPKNPIQRTNSTKRIKKTIVNYVNTYVKCSQCNAPDTVFTKQDESHC